MTDADDLDAVFDRVEALAKSRALLDVVRSTSYGTPALKVKNKSSSASRIPKPWSCSARRSKRPC